MSSFTWMKAYEGAKVSHQSPPPGSGCPPDISVRPCVGWAMPIVHCIDMRSLGFTIWWDFSGFRSGEGADRFRAVSGRLLHGMVDQCSFKTFEVLTSPYIMYIALHPSEGCGGNTHISGAAAAKGCRSPPGLHAQIFHEKQKTMKQNIKNVLESQSREVRTLKRLLPPAEPCFWDHRTY